MGNICICTFYVRSVSNVRMELKRNICNIIKRNICNIIKRNICNIITQVRHYYSFFGLLFLLNFLFHKLGSISLGILVLEALLPLILLFCKIWNQSVSWNFYYYFYSNWPVFCDRNILCMIIKSVTNQIHRERTVSYKNS